MTRPHRLPIPALVLAADHRARGVVTVERYGDYVNALAQALPACDGILATAQPLADLAAAGHLTAAHRTYLSINRTGLATSAFELDDRPVASVSRAAADGWTGVKHMTRIDMADPLTPAALELLGQVLEQSESAALEALIEPLVWRDGGVARDTDAIVFAAVIAHDMGHPSSRSRSPWPNRERNDSAPWPGWWPASACPSSSWADRSARPGGPPCSTRCAT